MQKKNIIFLAPLIFLSATLFPSGLPGIANKAAKKEKREEEVVPLLAQALDDEADPQRPANAAIQLAPSLAQAQRHNPVRPHNNTLSTQLKDVFEARAQEQFSADVKKRIDIPLIASTIVGFAYGYVFDKKVEIEDYHKTISLQFASENNDMMISIKHTEHGMFPHANEVWRFRLDTGATVINNICSNNTAFYSTKKTLMAFTRGMPKDREFDETPSRLVFDIDKPFPPSIFLHGQVKEFTTTPDGEYCIYSMRTPTHHEKIIVTSLRSNFSQKIDTPHCSGITASKTNHKQEFFLAVTNGNNVKIYKIEKDNCNLIDTFDSPWPQRSGISSSYVAISQEKNLVFRSLDDGTIVRKHIGAKKPLLFGILQPNGMHKLRFFNNESMIAMACESIMRIFNVDSFVPLQEINTFNWIHSFAISADDSMIAVTSGKHCFSVYRLGQEQDLEKEREAAAHQENDRHIAEANLVVHQPPTRPAQNSEHTRYEQASSRCNCVIS